MTDETAQEQEREVPSRSRAGRGAAKWAVRSLIWGVTLLAVLVVAGLFFLTRTSTGVRLTLDQLLARLEPSIAGTVTYESVSSPDLLSGTLLEGVEIRGTDGRLFARADSLELSYSIPALLRGDVVLYDLRAAGLEVIVERLPGRDRTNAERILQPDASQPDSAGSSRGILLRDVELERSRVTIRLPVDDPSELPEGAFTERGPSGEGLLRIYEFRDVRGRLPRVSISDPDREGQRLTVAELALEGAVRSEPFRVTRLRGLATIADSRLIISDADIRLPRSAARGRVVADWGGEGVVTSADLVMDAVELGELRWLAPDLPEARATGPLALHLGPDSTFFRMDAVTAVTDSSRVEAVGAVRVSPELAFRDLRVDLEPLATSELAPWLDEPLPVQGLLVGEAQLDGSVEAMAVGGQVALRRPALDSTLVRFSGIVSLDGPLAVQGFQLDVEPLDFRLARSVLGIEGLRGYGSVVLEADGSLGRGMRVVLDVEHQAPGLSRSRIEAAGTVRTDSVDAYLDLEGEVDPLDLRALREVVPEMQLDGEIEGPVRLTGRLGDLRVETELEAPQGRLAADARFDARDPAAGYTLEGSVREFRLSDLLGSLPSPTTVTGSVRARGAGLDRETLQGEAEITVRESSLARFAVDTARARVRFEDGTLRVDTLDAETNLAHFSASGALGLDAEHRDARLRVAFRNDSLRSARPLLLGDTVIAADTLSPLEREVLSLGGVDPDTLPTEASIALDGSLRGEVTLQGWLDGFSAEGTASIDDVVYGPNLLRRAEVDFALEGLPDLGGRMRATVTADSIEWLDRSLAGLAVDLDYTDPGGRVVLDVQRHEAEDYTARATFELDSLGGALELEDLGLRFDQVRWVLERPATVQWGEDGLRVRDFRLSRPGTDEMWIRADGVLPREGPADFELDVRRVSLERIGGLVQIDEPLAGLLDLELRVAGTARAPVASGVMSVDSVRFRNVLLTRVEGDVTYENERAGGVLLAWRNDLLAGRLEGSFPVDLALHEVEDRIPAAPVELRAVVDSFPIAVLATLVDAVEDVNGSVSGEVRLAGTPDDLRTSGSFRVADGGFRLPALGIRPVSVSGTVNLLPGSVAEVDLRGRSIGDLQVQGTVELTPPTNPTFDLSIQASGFQAIDRRDLQARAGGQITLRGTYQRPVVSGAARVQEGVLRIEEFARSNEVIDLSDPRFFDVVDTTMVSVGTSVGAEQNPFLQNLQVEVDLAVQRTWLRSEAMNVEMAGDLVVNWNRTSGDLVLTGELNAVRGTYTAFERQFQVNEGSIEFVGTPGLDPNLQIQAVTRLRTVQEEPLTVTASVTGTLAEPRVNLSSDAQPPIAESDLVSYLFFGRPSYALAQGETAVLQGALGAGSSFGLGFVANRLGSVVRDAGLDYFAVSQEAGFGATAGFYTGVQATVASTLVEAGRYVSEDVFVSVLLRPLTQIGSTTYQDRNPWAGVRAELELGDLWTLEGFVEDRVTRGQGISFGELEARLDKIWGLFLWREWGY